MCSSSVACDAAPERAAHAGRFFVSIEELTGDLDVDAVYGFIRALLTEYTQMLPADRRRLVERFSLARLARKAVGVGSVGTETWIILMEPDDGLAPLLLQAKEAQRSVLADYLGESEYDNQGERVVIGQRLMQAAGDILLGWVRATPPIGRSKDFYLRQMRDWKYTVEIGGMSPPAMTAYGRMCAWTLARAHARTGAGSPSPPTWASPTPLTRRSPALPRATPTGPKPTMPHWHRPSPSGGYKPRLGFESRPHSHSQRNCRIARKSEPTCRIGG